MKNMHKLLYAVIICLIAGACSQTTSSKEEGTEVGKTEKQSKPAKKMGHLSIKQFEQIREAGVSAVVIDVRTPEEIAEGKIPGSIEIDFEGKDFEEKVGALERERSYIVYCAKGIRSSEASEYMLQNGFKNVFNLDGGYEAWEKEVSKSK